MDNHAKLSIYKGIIQYLVESTNYTLKNIAELSSTSVEHIRAIYCQDTIPPEFISESELVRIYQTVLTLQPRENNISRYLVEINKL